MGSRISPDRRLPSGSCRRRLTQWPPNRVKCGSLPSWDCNLVTYPRRPTRKCRPTRLASRTDPRRGGPDCSSELGEAAARNQPQSVGVGVTRSRNVRTRSDNQRPRGVGIDHDAAGRQCNPWGQVTRGCGIVTCADPGRPPSTTQRGRSIARVFSS
jgi:hypothetical protein